MRVATAGSLSKGVQDLCSGLASRGEESHLVLTSAERVAAHAHPLPRAVSASREEYLYRSKDRLHVAEPEAVIRPGELDVLRSLTGPTGRYPPRASRGV